jgi:5-oxoprolinase (ATP-hydrolysing) subunit C
MTLRVLEPGLHTLVVDGGRPAYRSLGVPLSGAADPMALALGNGLVGNAPEAAGLEVSLVGPTLEAACDLACVVFGAPFSLGSDHQDLRPGTTFTLRTGERLQIGGTATGMRAYFCIRGGFQMAPILGSRSALGPVRAGDELPCLAGTIQGRFLRIDRNGVPSQAPFVDQLAVHALRVLPGAQSEWFQASEFFPQEFGVLPASNRMGLRLQGKALSLPARELVSEPVCPGSVQVTRDGQCIVLGVDGQTIGGYPKIAQVISADLDRLGQLRPGDRLRFSTVSLNEAERLYHARQKVLREWVLRLSLADLFPPPVRAAPASLTSARAAAGRPGTRTF